MTEAIIGLVGVLVGGLVSGGVTTRRAERARLRAAARLVENELEHVRNLVWAGLMNVDILRKIETTEEWAEIWVPRTSWPFQPRFGASTRAHSPKALMGESDTGFNEPPGA